MKKRKHLFIAFARKGWGETLLGLEVARQVRDAGGSVSFLAHTTGYNALSGSGFEVQEVPEHMEPLIWLVLEERIASERFDSIVLCDFQTTDNTLYRSGIDPARLLDFGVPLIALDTWQCALTGMTIDVLSASRWEIGEWLNDIGLRLVPVPIGQPSSPGSFRCLPPPVSLSSGSHKRLRKTLGLSESDRVILFCTGAWQHGVADPDAQRIESAVPVLVWNYLERADPSVRLIHIGPAPILLKEVTSRYRWISSLPAREFDDLLMGVDLMLTLNVSATTIARAMRAGVPVLVAQNSYRMTTANEAEALLPGPVSADLRAWLEGAVPLYPFSMWPLGFWKFLQPLLRENPYLCALEKVELLDEVAFVDTCRSLLINAEVRGAALEKHKRYIALVDRLPTASERIDDFLDKW